MTTSMYCLYVGFDYTYIDVNALAQGIKSFLASHFWSQAVAGARTYGTDSPAITSIIANFAVNILKQEYTYYDVGLFFMATTGR